MSIYNRNRNNMSIQVNKDQNLSKGMWDAIQLEAQLALPYLPAEDKVNLALATVSTQVIADPNPKDTLRQMTLQLKEDLDKAQTLIASLEANQGKGGK
jgi:hypothetical protein